MKYLITGVAGFIGAAVCKKLCEQGHQVVGVDNLNDYYSPALKLSRLAQIKHANFLFIKGDIGSRALINSLCFEYQFDGVIHLAAQAGVRYSIDNPQAYINTNLVGFFNVIDVCAQHHVAHFIYASSSSVYGNSTQPFSTDDDISRPLSLYAATKVSNEAIAHSYAHIHGLPVTGLRFFTVYGPWGRPDMALFKFTDAIINDLPIDVFNHGKLSRDFTYIDDIVEGIVRVVPKSPLPEKGAQAPFKLLNIGAGKPTQLMDFIAAIESALGKKAQCNFVKMQTGDVVATWADTRGLEEYVDYRPRIDVATGVKAFVDWYQRDYLHHNVNLEN